MAGGWCGGVEGRRVPAPLPGAGTWFAGRDVVWAGSLGARSDGFVAGVSGWDHWFRSLKGFVKEWRFYVFTTNVFKFRMSRLNVLFRHDELS